MFQRMRFKPGGPRMFVRRDLARRVMLLALLPAGFGALTGCQGIVGSTPTSQLRVIDASPDAPGLDIYQNGNLLAPNLGFGTISSYIPITPPGVYTVTADSAGTKQVLVSAKNTFAASTQYTLLVGDVSASLQGTILVDQSQAAPSGEIALRFIDQATRISAVDVYLVPPGQTLVNVSPVFTGLTFGVNTGYRNIPTGTYTIVMVPTGTIPTSTTTATYSGQQVTYSGGSATTIIILDQLINNNPALQVISATDYQVPSAS